MSQFLLLGGGGAALVALVGTVLGYWWKTSPERKYRKWLHETLMTIHAIIDSRQGNTIRLRPEEIEFAHRAVVEGYLAMPFPDSVSLASLVNKKA